MWTRSAMPYSEPPTRRAVASREDLPGDRVQQRHERRRARGDRVDEVGDAPYASASSASLDHAEMHAEALEVAGHLETPSPPRSGGQNCITRKRASTSEYSSCAYSSVSCQSAIELGQLEQLADREPRTRHHRPVAQQRAPEGPGPSPPRACRRLRTAAIVAPTSCPRPSISTRSRSPSARPRRARSRVRRRRRAPRRWEVVPGTRPSFSKSISHLASAGSWASGDVRSR